MRVGRGAVDLNAAIRSAKATRPSVFPGGLLYCIDKTGAKGNMRLFSGERPKNCKFCASAAV